MNGLNDVDLMKEDKKTLIGIIHGLLDVIHGRVCDTEELNKRLKLD